MFVATFVFGVLAKLWRAFDLFLEADAVDGFVWLPLGVWSELLVAAALALGVGAIARVNVWLSGAAIGVGGGYLLFWLALNDVSFRLTQVGISYARLRGDEGVGTKDFSLMSPGDVTPAIVYAVVAVVVGGAAGVFAYRRAPARSLGLLAAALVAGLAGTVVDRAFFAERNFGMGESPVMLLARTYVSAFFGREEAQFPSPLPPPKTKAERLALLAAQQPLASTSTSPTTTPPRAAPRVDNGILFFAEGVPRKRTSLEAIVDTTPHLKALWQEKGGINFENYYSTYHKSIAAIYSMICADVPPPNAKNIMELNPRIDCGSLPEVFSKAGIHVGLFHGGDFGFYDKLQLLGARGFETQKDARALATKETWENSWGVDDRAVVDAVLAWIDSLPKGERFFAVIIPITAHYPYDIPPDVAPAFPGRSSKDKFDSAVHFLDDAFFRLHQGLAARGVASDTAIAYVADHGETVAEPPRASAGRRLAYEPSLHVPFVLLAPKLFPTAQTNARLGSHIDLLPTLMDALGLPPDERHLGQSLLSDDHVPRRAFIGASNGPRFVGFVDGKEKFFVNRYSGAAELYDLVTDPLEQKNLAGVDANKTARLIAEAIAFADGQLAHLTSAPRMSDDIDVQALLLANARVRVTKSDGSGVDCVRPDGDGVDGVNGVNGVDDRAAAADNRGLDTLPFRRVCPGLTRSPFLGNALYRAGRTRDCVLVNVPDGGGSVDIVVDDKNADGTRAGWLPFLTRVRAAVSKETAKGEARLRLTAFGDGKAGQNKPVGGAGEVRVSFPSSQDTLTIRVSGDAALLGPVCLTFTEAAWRTAKGAKTNAKTSATKNDDDQRGAVDDDEAHGKAQKDDE